MGTNYYLHESDPCPTCGHAKEPLHIGKSSGGWCFSLHVDPEKGINDLPDWEDRWAKPHAKIIDEYGHVIEIGEMRGIILARTWPRAERHDKKYLDDNHAESGPLGLLRHRIGPYCIGHGSGTYDLIQGNFS